MRDATEKCEMRGRKHEMQHKKCEMRENSHVTMT